MFIGGRDADVVLPALLSVQGLCKSFGGLTVTDAVSFDVHENEILGVIGPNGAGKTTLFALLSGSLPQDTGSIFFQGRDISDMAVYMRARAGIARTFQIPRPFTHMTVFENLKVAAQFGGGMDEDEAENWVHRVMVMTELENRSHLLAGSLTLLMRKRHELARALALRPKLLLVDEVAAGLTDNEVADFISLVQSIRKSGVTIMWIEHVMKTMLTATDRLLALHSGRILATGQPSQVIELPEVRRVYLGA